MSQKSNQIRNKAYSGLEIRNWTPGYEELRWETTQIQGQSNSVHDSNGRSDAVVMQQQRRKAKKNGKSIQQIIIVVLVTVENFSYYYYQLKRKCFHGALATKILSDRPL